MVLKQKNLLDRFRINRLGVFGSFARNEPANDIDLLIEDDLPLETALQFKRELEAIVDNSLDIMIKRWANPNVLCRGEKDMVYVEG
ncbi:MAG: nucleotidyltransferase family protein [Nitrospinota bacterium]